MLICPELTVWRQSDETLPHTSTPTPHCLLSTVFTTRRYGTGYYRESASLATASPSADEHRAPALGDISNRLNPGSLVPNKESPPSLPPSAPSSEDGRSDACPAIAASTAATAVTDASGLFEREPLAPTKRSQSHASEVQALREQLAEQQWLLKATVGAVEDLLLKLRLPPLKHALNDLRLPADGKKDELAARLIEAMAAATPREKAAPQWRGVR